VTAQHPAFVATLRGSRIEAVIICGIAANICCFFAAKDLRQAGFRVYMVEDASAGIDVPAASLFQAQAKAEGQQLGIQYVRAHEILKAVEPKS
jgi:nicotinamidase/pyrazinamidase